MGERTRELKLLGLVVIGLAGLAAACSSSGPDDCWGGSLSEEPLQCYVLAQAQADGVIEVDGIYASPQNALHIYLRQTNDVGSREREVFIQKTRDFLQTSQGRELYEGRGGEYEACSDLQGVAWQDCVMTKSLTAWRGVSPWSGRLVPPSSGRYVDILLHVGGSAARRAEGAWASWRQLWPGAGTLVTRSEPGGTRDRTGDGKGPSSRFDVSDVDTTNIPDPNCKDNFGDTMWQSCRGWIRVPEKDIAGVHSAYEKGSTIYVQVKAAGRDQAELEALFAESTAEAREAGRDQVIIPVKYNFGELWRWQVILDRFALSAGNTIGITKASVNVNDTAYDGEETFPLEDLRPVKWEDKAALRNTIVLYTLDAQSTQDALSELLPLLGIPVDAVGMLVQKDERHRINIWLTGD